MSARTAWWADTGTEVQVELPGADGVVTARIVRSENGLLALTFRQDDAMLRRVDRALARIGDGTAAAAA